jgi:hypothetical protein
LPHTPLTGVAEIEAMIAEAKRLRVQNREAGRQIEAAACAIRQRALEDALAAIKRAS